MSTVSRGKPTIIFRYPPIPESEQVFVDYPRVKDDVNDAIGLNNGDQVYIALDAISGKDLDQKIADWGKFAAYVYLDQLYTEFVKTGEKAKATATLHSYSLINDKNPKTNDGTVLSRPGNPGLVSRPGAYMAGVPTFSALGKILKTADTWKASDPTNLKNYLTELAAEAGAKGNTALVEELGKIYELASGFKKPATFGQKVSAAVKSVTQKAKTLSLAPARAAFLGLLKLNVFGMASDLQPLNAEFQKRKAGQAGYDSGKSDKYIKIRDLFYKWGGARGDFDKIIASGSKNKALLGADGDHLYVAGETVAMITAATPLIVAVMNLLGKKPSGMDAATEAKLKAEAAANQATIDAALEQTTPGEDENKVPTWVWVGLGGLVLVIGGVLVYKFVIKKK